MPAHTLQLLLGQSESEDDLANWAMHWDKEF